MQLPQSILIALAAIPAIQVAFAAPAAAPAPGSGVDKYGDYGNYGKVCPGPLITRLLLTLSAVHQLPCATQARGAKGRRKVCFIWRLQGYQGGGLQDIVSLPQLERPQTGSRSYFLSCEITRIWDSSLFLRCCLNRSPLVTAYLRMLG